VLHTVPTLIEHFESAGQLLHNHGPESDLPDLTRRSIFVRSGHVKNVSINEVIRPQMSEYQVARIPCTNATRCSMATLELRGESMPLRKRL